MIRHESLLRSLLPPVWLGVLLGVGLLWAVYPILMLRLAWVLLNQRP